MKTTIIVAHPHWNHSKIIKGITKEIQNRRNYVDVRVLDPKGNFSIKEEQEYLLKYDNIVFAFPLWWYQAPWTLKKYFDEILQPGFAFSYSGGKEQFKLLNKKFSYIVSSGSPKKIYQEGGAELHTIENFLQPIHGIFHLLSTGGSALNKKPKLPKEYMFEPTFFYGSAMPETNIDQEIEATVNEFIKKI